MDVGITELRAELSHWLDQVRKGDEVVVTDRGVPIARIVSVTTSTTLERLTAEGAISAPVSPTKPVATGAHRTRAKRPVADLVAELRD